MKKICIVFLILSLLCNIFLVSKYSDYINMRKTESENIIRAATYFENINNNLERLVKEKSISEYELSTLQEQVTIVCYEFESFAADNKIELSEKDDIYKKCMTLKDIVFKINNESVAEDSIIKAVIDNELVEYFKILSSASRRILNEKYGENIKYNELGVHDGVEFYKELLKELKS